MKLSYMNRTQICKFRALDETPSHYFCLGSVSKYFKSDKINEIPLKGNVYDF